MIELTQKDREKLAQAPIGRLALKRIEDLEFELKVREAQVEIQRQVMHSIEAKVQANNERILELAESLGAARERGEDDAWLPQTQPGKDQRRGWPSQKLKKR